MRLIIGPILLISLLLFGCGAGNPYYPVPKELGVVASAYEDIVRWRELEKMYQFGKPDNDWKVQPNLANVRVTDYESAGLSEIGPNRWGQSAVISYVLRDRQVVKQVLDQQIWVSDDEGKSWFRENPPPQF